MLPLTNATRGDTNQDVDVTWKYNFLLFIEA